MDRWSYDMNISFTNISFQFEHKAKLVAANIDRLLDYKYDLSSVYEYQNVWYVHIDQRMSTKDRWIVADFLTKIGVQ